jgi:hypothetical protein
MGEVPLTADDLLAGAAVTFEVMIPASVLRPGQQSQTAGDEQAADTVVHIRPLTIGTFQLIMRAARREPELIPLLMIKEALVQPVLALEQVKRLHLGLVNCLIAHIREISGLTEKKTSLTD